MDGKGNRRGKENEGKGIERKRVSTNFLKLGPAREKSVIIAINLTFWSFVSLALFSCFLRLRNRAGAGNGLSFRKPRIHKTRIAYRRDS